MQLSHFTDEDIKVLRVKVYFCEVKQLISGQARV